MAPRDHGHRGRSRDPLDRLIRLQRRDSRSYSAGAGKGALWGGVAGVLLGLGTAATLCSGGFSCEGSDLAAGSLIIGGAGAGVGALVGALMLNEEWREVPVEGAGEDRR